MKLIINHIPIRIKKKNYNFSKYSIDGIFDKMPKGLALEGSILIRNGNKKQFLNVIDYCLNHSPDDGELNIYFQAQEISKIKKFLNKEMRYIRAAGGVARKGDKILMIYRLGKWDLPKGKIEIGEGTKEGAVREVEEECGVTVVLRAKLLSTWHSYYRKNKFNIKKTTWYIMDCVDDSHKTPQLDEGIEKAEWKTKEEVMMLMENTYANIRVVVDIFYRVITENNTIR